MYAKFVKRWVDFLLSLLAIVFLSPLFVILTIIGAIKMKGNPFFTQERPGWHENIFKLIKFRTMTNERDDKGNLLPDEDRLIPYGKFLRSTSLDELPELFNILIGQLSIIGPRPLLVSYLQYYTEEEHHRHDVRPGLTGYAQVHGRNYVTWEDKFKMDLWYVEHISFLTDLKILFDTVMVVFKRENIETASKIVHDGVVYQPLDVERSSKGDT
ncbi:MAG: sugar transferase [Lachnospiraceae bacterium]|nr:sugar transferase [Lachnospiraceae bacterium]